MEPAAQALVDNWQLIAWLLVPAALAGQNWANTRTLKDRQDRTNLHLAGLNGKTYRTHGQVQKICGALSTLPCRSGDPLTVCEWDDEVEEPEGGG